MLLPKLQYFIDQIPYLEALQKLAAGDPEGLSQYLRSDAHFGKYERELLAQAHEGEFTRPKRPGRPFQHDVRAVLMVADGVYRRWKALNKQRGINDHGQSDAMRSECVRFVLDELEPGYPSDIGEKVLDLMPRSASRKSAMRSQLHAN